MIEAILDVSVCLIVVGNMFLVWFQTKETEVYIYIAKADLASRFSQHPSVPT